MGKYYVDSFYDYRNDPPIDYVTIGKASAEDFEYDGENWCGKEDAYSFNIYNSLREAIKNAGYWPTKIRFSPDLSKEEKRIALDTVNDLISDHEFTKMFRRQVEGPVTISDLCFESKSSEKEEEFDYEQ